MPHSLVLLDHHFSASTYQFLYDNAQILFDLGYRRMCFELYREHTPSNYMKAVKKQIDLRPSSPAIEHSRYLYKTYEKFTQIGIHCQFIDPEREEIGINFNKQFLHAYNTKDYISIQRLDIERKETVKQRDLIMKNTLLEANCRKGGVIFVGGFMHTTLVQELDKETRNTANPFRYLIIFGEPLHRVDPESSNEEQYHNWYAMRDPSFRREFYQTDAVQCIDSKQNYSFEMISAILDLSFLKTEAPEDLEMASLFRKKTELPFNFCKDEHLIVSASLDVNSSDAPAIIQKITNLFPGLCLFSQKFTGSNQTRIHIPGVNLNEQLPVLEKGFSMR